MARRHVAAPSGQLLRYDDAQTIAFPWKVNPSELPSCLSQPSVSSATEPMTLIAGGS
jgi:hypothetical protein